MNCPGCGFEKFPTCTVNNIICSISVEDLICDNRYHFIPYLVCHNNSQEISTSCMITKSTCDQCGLCYYICPKINAAPSFNSIEKHLFADLGRLNIFFSNALPEDYVVASEVKCKGNAREKRIDLLIKNDMTITFVKVVNNVDRIPYYSRSYENVVNYYSESFPNFDFKQIILVPNNKLVEGLDNKCKTLHNLLEYLLEEK